MRRDGRRLGQGHRINLGSLNHLGLPSRCPYCSIGDVHPPRIAFVRDLILYRPYVAEERSVS